MDRYIYIHTCVCIYCMCVCVCMCVCMYYYLTCSVSLSGAFKVPLKVPPLNPFTLDAVVARRQTELNACFHGSISVCVCVVRTAGQL